MNFLQRFGLIIMLVNIFIVSIGVIPKEELLYYSLAFDLGIVMFMLGSHDSRN